MRAVTPCLVARTQSQKMVYCNESCQVSRDDLNPPGCHFCSDFMIVRYLYLAFSVLSALSCLLVFLTYILLPRLRHGGYSSRVFIYRTILDFLIALGHIIAVSARFQNGPGESRKYGCMALGAFNVFTLMASNMWYLVLAVDLIKAIRNPFSAAPTYGAVAHTAVWGIATLSTVIPAICCREPGLGLSMFNWCWISITHNLNMFLGLSLAVYYLPHFFIWIFSTVVLIFTFSIFWGGRFAASSETRKFVMKQNVVYVLVLGMETSLIIPLWVIQLGVLRGEGQDFSRPPQFYTHTDLALAVMFAVIHSLRGTIDLLVWWVTFSIGPRDFKSVYLRLKACLKRSPDSVELADSTSLHTRLIKADTVVNRALRRDAIYCINVGILDAVKLNVDQQQRDEMLGSVREPFVAQAMVLWDEENRKAATEDRLASSPYHEQTERRITFPSSASIQKFVFQDIEPTVFHYLRDVYRISSAEYRQSFRLKNAADVESSGMLEKFTEGKSGSFFYFSHDFRYIIKTVTSEEERFLHRISYCYYNHMKQNPNSLIVRFFGLHKVRLAPEQRYISVVVMENIFYNRFQLKMNTIYDLKGSTVGRRALKGSRTRASYHGTLKDLDLNDSIVIGPEAKAQLMEQLEQDVTFLTQCGIMDYSLLLGIHEHMGERPSRFDSTSIELEGSSGNSIVDVNVGHGRASYSSISTLPVTLDRHCRSPSPSSHTEDSRSLVEPHMKWFRQDLGGLRSFSPFHPCTLHGEQVDSHASSITEYKGIPARDLPVATYFFGVVDILQQYNLRKKAEHFWKTNFLCQNKRELSAIRQQEYGERFLRAMDKIFQ